MFVVGRSLCCHCSVMINSWEVATEMNICEKNVKNVQCTFIVIFRKQFLMITHVTRAELGKGCGQQNYKLDRSTQIGAQIIL